MDLFDPKHLLLYRWLDLEPPAFAHMPLLRDERKAKISKRKSPWARLTWFREQGYLPEALVNFLALQGYPPIVEDDGTEREVFTFEEFAARFDWAKVNPAGSIFNLDKLDWLNGVWIRELPLGSSPHGCCPSLRPTACCPATRPRRAGAAQGDSGAHPDPDRQADRGWCVGCAVLHGR